MKNPYIFQGFPSFPSDFERNHQVLQLPTMAAPAESSYVNLLGEEAKAKDALAGHSASATNGNR